MPDSESAAYHRATTGVVDTAQRQVTNTWTNLLLTRLSEQAVNMWLDAASPVVWAVQNLVGSLTSTFLAHRTDTRPLPVIPAEVIGRKGVSIRDEYMRPVRHARQLQAQGMSTRDLITATAPRIDAMVRTDAQMAKVRQARRSLTEAGVTRYRRVPHPELSKSGKSCPLCLLASTKVYKTEDLLPIHERCNCSIDIIEQSDLVRVGGKLYVGLRELDIPEEYTRIGPRGGNADTAHYLAMMAKENYDEVDDAYWAIVQEEWHDEIGPMLKPRVLPRRIIPADVPGRTPIPEKWQGYYDYIMRDPDRTGLGKDVLWLPTEEVYKFREYDRTDENMLVVKRAIEDRGKIVTPISLRVDANGAMINEGNNRIAAARELGMEYVPVKIYRVDVVKPNDVGSRGPQPLTPLIAEAVESPEKFAVIPGFKPGRIEQPMMLTDLADEDYELVEAINDDINNIWQRTDFDDYKDAIRWGAREAQINGYPSMTMEQAGAFNTSNPDDLRLAGKELAARATWNDPTEEVLYRGIRVTPDHADRILEGGKGAEISLPLSSFTDDEPAAEAFANGQMWWESRSIPKGEKRAVVFELEPGAQVAAISGSERVTFGRFKVIDTPHVSSDGTIYVPIEQTSLVEDMTTALPRRAPGMPEIPEMTIIEKLQLPENQPEELVSTFADLTDDIMKPIPPGVTDAMTYEEAVDTFKQRWPNIAVAEPRRWATPESKYLAADIFRAADETLSAHPNVASRVGSVGVGEMFSAGLAEMTPADKDGFIESVLLDRTLIEDHPPQVIKQIVKEGVDMGWYHQSTQDEPAYSTMVHEMGHVLDGYGRFIAAEGAKDEMFDMFRESFPAGSVERKSLQEYVETMRGRPFARDVDVEQTLFTGWLRAQFPGDVFHDDEFSMYEAIAEAYQDVIINGIDASPASKRLNRLLLDEVHMEDNYVLRGGR